ncbi:MAG: hypothetical protein ABR584_08140 [Candidatus Baltobacteraceae bacterium]
MTRIFFALLLAVTVFSLGAQRAHAQSAVVPSTAPSPTTAPPATRAEDASPKPSSAPTPVPSPTGTPGPPFGNMQWREVGPALPGGRVSAVGGSTTDANLYWMGAAGGGAWKSTDAGLTWNPVFEKQKVSAIGALAVDQKNNDVVWVGTGEANPRNDVSYGDGVYKTSNGGKDWTNVGLPNSRHISRILIDPNNSNHVVIGVLGNVFGDSEDRGVYVTEDGGKTWSKTLYLSPSSGVSDMAMDVRHPNTMFAGMWHFRREPWTMHSGGEDDGLFKSTDGGRSWTKLTGHGLPSGTMGRIGLAVAPSNGRVYATIESAEGILWRSDDNGGNWKLTSNDTLITQRPFYFSHIEVDPMNPDHIYSLAANMAQSTDGGKTFKSLTNQAHGDYHTIWIAQNQPGRMIIGEDGGIATSLDSGKTWIDGRNYPIGQVYHVATSKENPYQICGGWQDNNGWCGPSNSLDPSGILNKNWINPVGGDGMWLVPDPVDPNWIWADSQDGFVTVYNKQTKDFVFIQPYLQTAMEQYDLSTSKYRFNWDSPIAFAPWDGHIAWVGGNVIFQSKDRGRHWSVISPDLTRNTKGHQQPSGGPITHDVSGAEYSDNLLDIEGSALSAGEIWTGSDDGMVHLTRDGGKHWSDVTPAGVPEYGRVETVAPSSTDRGTAYANFDFHKSGDFKPYVYATHDYGKTWKSIVNNLPADQYVRAIRPDLHNHSILYAGTENGLWISLDSGARWQDFKNNLPTVSVRDIRFQPQWNDLLIATHGRALYVMDDMRPVQQLAQEVARGAMVFTPRTAYIYNLHGDDEGNYTDYTGNNPPFGAVITFYQKTPGKESPVIQILNSQNRVIRTARGTHKVNGKDLPWVTNKTGINQWTWDFNVDGPVKWLGAAKEFFQGPNEGAQVPPGRYSVRMTLGGHTMTRTFEVKRDPRTTFTDKQLTESSQLSNLFNHYLSVVDAMLNNLDTVKKQLTAAGNDPKVQADAALSSAVGDTLAEHQKLFDRLTANYANGEDSLQRPGKLREDVGGAPFSIVTDQFRSFEKRIRAEYEGGVLAYNQYVGSLANLNTKLQAAGLKPLTGGTHVSP